MRPTPPSASLCPPRAYTRGLMTSPSTLRSWSAPSMGATSIFQGGDVRGLAATPANASVSFALAQTTRYYCARPPTEGDEGACETPALPSLSAHHVSFKPCTALLRQYVVEYDATTTYFAARGARAAVTCARHSRWCTGANAQYGSFGECMAAIDALPAFSCAAAVFQGNSAICRFKHSFMLRYRPEVALPPRRPRLPALL
eukprot:TRINITY_DN1785_c0_g1_i2.p1 TRINITY_DN1785_c0_g1~~TRINITY_DN1785_c0_g1_i2.p1  ORF type:complete len:201 (-),score=37.79 TRINITY_DN1785_c0_g1_i2:299-901(-)